MTTPELTEAQHAVIEEVTRDAVALLEYAGFTPEHSRYVLILETALDLASAQDGQYAVECLEKVLREMKQVTKELE